MKVFGVVGHSGMGKTTLLERLIPELVQRGLRVSLIKHSHKALDIDHRGKDSYRLREAGCSDVIVVGRARWALVQELGADDEPTLAELAAHLRPCDVLLIEGMKAGDFPKLEVWRAGLDRAPLWPELSGVVATAGDHCGFVGPSFALDDATRIVDFMLDEGHAGQRRVAGNRPKDEERVGK